MHSSCRDCGVWCLVLACMLAAPSRADAQDTDGASEGTSLAPEALGAYTTRELWELGLLSAAIAGLATGVTLVTVNHARVQDYNLGVEAYDEGVDQNPQTLAQLAALRNSINTQERWGYIVGAVGLAAAVTAGWLYVTDEDDAPLTLAPGPQGLMVFGRF